MSTAEQLRQALPTTSDHVATGLCRTPKSLPPSLFYDAEGSHLFEQITTLPEYYLTRAEREVLEAGARDIVELAGSNLTLLELGAGTATKTGIVIAAMLRRQLRVGFYPIDVSATALEIARERLRTEFPAVKVTPVVADYTHGLGHLSSLRGRKLVLYLGSSIGNFEPHEAATILRSVRSQLGAGDCLLLGTDLVKSAAVLVPAYNDTRRVTAAFNLNMLSRINRELGGHFDLHTFRHVACWNREQSRMEMYLESMREQTVPIDLLNLEVRFAAGERIHTENSYKYTPAMVQAMLAEGGFTLERTWKDSRQWFAVHLARVS